MYSTVIIDGLTLTAIGSTAAMCFIAFAETAEEWAIGLIMNACIAAQYISIEQITNYFIPASATQMIQV